MIWSHHRSTLFVWVRLPLGGQESLKGARFWGTRVTVDGMETVIVGDMISGAPY